MESSKWKYCLLSLKKFGICDANNYLLNLARRDDGIKAEITEAEPEFFTTTFANYEIIVDENDIFIYENHIDHDIKTDIRTLLKQLMTVFFDNAVKYTEEDIKLLFIWSRPFSTLTSVR